MKIYNYDHLTGEFLNKSIADLDPLETKLKKKNIYTLPAYATTIKPPETKNGEVAVFVNGQWEIKQDLRGNFFLNPETLEELKITEIGQEAPFDYVKKENVNSKPDPFYHKPKRSVIDGVNKLEWREEPKLRTEYEAKLAKESFKQNLISYFNNILKDLPGIKSMFQPVMNAAIIEFDNDNISEVRKIIATAMTFSSHELETIQAELLKRIDDFIQGV